MAPGDYPGGKEHLSKLGLQKSLRGASSAAETAICGLGGLILKRANSPPRITARRGGGVTKKIVRSLLMDAAGVVFLVPSIGTPPRPREKRMLRNIFVIARPPLLAVMRGGEFAILKIVPSLDSSGRQGGRCADGGVHRFGHSLSRSHRRHDK